MKIAIIGKMCSGKTTIADLILEKDKSYKRRKSSKRKSKK